MAVFTTQCICGSSMCTGRNSCTSSLHECRPQNGFHDCANDWSDNHQCKASPGSLSHLFSTPGDEDVWTKDSCKTACSNLPAQANDICCFFKAGVGDLDGEGDVPPSCQANYDDFTEVTASGSDSQLMCPWIACSNNCESCSSRTICTKCDVSVTEM